MNPRLRICLVVVPLLVACGGAVEENASSTTTTSLATSTSTATPTLPVETTSTTQLPTTSTTVVTRSSTPTSTLAPTTTTSLPAGWSLGAVVSVVDGDTIDVRLDDGVVERLRLIGTNSPEGGECFAVDATEGLESLIGGQIVYLEPDVSDHDQFGRLLRYVWTPDGMFVNEITVAQGWAIAREYPPDTSRSAQLQAAQKVAIEAGAGLWASDACGEPVPSDVQVVNVEYDAPGNDNFNLNGEWVEILNADDVSVDLTGWVLKDESATHRYPFPTGFTLQPGGSVIVYTGCGEDTADSLYWCATGSAVWNNGGDTAFLLDPDGNIVFSFAYS